MTLYSYIVCTIKGAIGVVADLIKVAAGTLPEAKFVMVMPITRPGVKWYTHTHTKFIGATLP